MLKIMGMTYIPGLIMTVMIIGYKRLNGGSSL
jgi:hypothetical protein